MTEIFGNLVIEPAGRRIVLMRQPIHPAGAGFARPFKDCLYQRPTKTQAACVFGYKQILQIAVVTTRPARTVKNIMHDPDESAADIGAQQKHRFVGVVKALPSHIGGTWRKDRLVECKIAVP
jgi:hypothetical protein